MAIDKKVKRHCLSMCLCRFCMSLRVSDDDYVASSGATITDGSRRDIGTAIQTRRLHARKGLPSVVLPVCCGHCQ